MNESLPDKVFRLGHSLATRPKDVSRWLTSWHVLPIRSGLPWLAWGAVDFLDRFLTRSHSVFEYGTGGSTLFFAKRAKRVMSVEDDPRWQRIVRDRLAEESLENVTLCPADSSVEPYARSPYVLALDQPHDVILVDGHEHRQGVDRLTCFRQAEQFVRAGGVIVLDGAWRFDLQIGDTRARDVTRHEGIGPGRKWVTRTDVFHF
jgi:hypothetical protein